MARIVLIHAVTVALDPIEASFKRLWPDADLVNLLDDSLSPDRAKSADLTTKMTIRIGVLADYASSLGAAGILFTCSAFGPAIEAAASNISLPVLKPNEAMFEQALLAGRRVGLLATFPPSVATMEDEFRHEARRFGGGASIETVLVPEALIALKRGDAATHNRLLAERAPDLGHCDVICLAHFSTSRALGAVSAAIGRPVLTSPDAAVAKLRRMIADTAP